MINARFDPKLEIQFSPSYIAMESRNIAPDLGKKPIPKKYSNILAKSIKLKYRANRMKQRVEYNKLRKLVPQISHIPKNKLTKLLILEETIKHIAHLERQVMEKFSGKEPLRGDLVEQKDNTPSRTINGIAGMGTSTLQTTLKSRFPDLPSNKECPPLT